MPKPKDGPGFDRNGPGMGPGGGQRPPRGERPPGPPPSGGGFGGF